MWSRKTNKTIKRVNRNRHAGRSKAHTLSNLLSETRSVCLLSFYVRAFVITTFILFTFICLAHAEMDLTKSVVHHTASHDVSAKEIDGWHKGQGWDGIGYHFVIRANGDIEKGRDINKKGAHAIGRNEYIGIVLTGYDVFTKEQIKALENLIDRLDIKHIERHHEKCPGEGLDVEGINERISE